MHLPLLIFTDLDGTLLDHHTYSYKGAEDALRRLRQLAIPLILASSKTKAEILKLQARLGLNEPFIAENGGGIFLPDPSILTDPGLLEDLGGIRGRKFGLPYNRIRSIFQSISARYGAKGFGDMTTEEIMLTTGLPREDAVLAAKRDFSEPFLFQAEPHPQDFQADAAEHGLTVTRGGRFFHLLAAGQNKGRAVRETAALFQAGCKEKIISAGLGDAENDIPMLEAVDIPVLIPKPNGSFVDIELKGLRRAPYPGSKGWGAAVAAVLEDFHPGVGLDKACVSQ